MSPAPTGIVSSEELNWAFRALPAPTSVGVLEATVILSLVARPMKALA